MEDETIIFHRFFFIAFHRNATKKGRRFLSALVQLLAISYWPLAYDLDLDLD